MAICLLLTSQPGKTVARCTYCMLGEPGQGSVVFDSHQTFEVRGPYFQPIIKRRVIESHFANITTWVTIVVHLFYEAKYPSSLLGSYSSQIQFPSLCIAGSSEGPGEPLRSWDVCVYVWRWQVGVNASNEPLLRGRIERGWVAQLVFQQPSIPTFCPLLSFLHSSKYPNMSL